jgi:predicted Holliday junction resolvase-like endonuclease
MDLIIVIPIIVFLLVFLGVTIIFGWIRIGALKKALANKEEKLKKTTGQKKSSEVRLGKIAENMAPFFDDWPYDPNSFRFLGNPIDGIQFTEDEVIFIEIKSGKARLTNSQKLVKQLVKEGKVKFATFRVGEEGSTFHMEE